MQRTKPASCEAGFVLNNHQIYVILEPEQLSHHKLLTHAQDFSETWSRKQDKRHTHYFDEQDGSIYPQPQNSVDSMGPLSAFHPRPPYNTFHCVEPVAHVALASSQAL